MTNSIDITLVLDRSGSMEAVRESTISGVNRFITDQQKDPEPATMTVHRFDDVFETVYAGKDIKQAPLLNTSTFVPRGSTALHDAIGRAITDTGKRLELQPEATRAGKVVFVIVTDGFENASKEFSKPKIVEMIRHQEEKYAWQFVYLGANQDAMTEAHNFGIPIGNAMTYTTNVAGVQNVYTTVSANLRSFKKGLIGNMGFSAQDHKSQEDAAKEP